MTLEPEVVAPEDAVPKVPEAATLDVSQTPVTLTTALRLPSMII